jgi:hypothetical protein
VALPASVLPEEMTHAVIATPAVLANDLKKPRPTTSRRAKPTTEVAHVAPPIEERAPASFNNAVATEELMVSERSYEAEQPTEAEPVPDPKSATLFLAVKPWGEVYVDGRKVGITPPLKSFDVPIGRHRITITNSSLPTYQREVTVEPDTKITVAHDFTCVSTREKICREGFGKGLEWRSRLETAEAAHPQQPSRQ